MKPSDLQVARFSGLNTVEDPLNMGLSWLTQADNVNITSAIKELIAIQEEAIASAMKPAEGKDLQKLAEFFGKR